MLLVKYWSKKKPSRTIRVTALTGPRELRPTIFKLSRKRTWIVEHFFTRDFMFFTRGFRNKLLHLEHTILLPAVICYMIWEPDSCCLFVQSMYLQHARAYTCMFFLHIFRFLFNHNRVRSEPHGQWFLFFQYIFERRRSIRLVRKTICKNLLSLRSTLHYKYTRIVFSRIFCIFRRHESAKDLSTTEKRRFRIV